MSDCESAISMFVSCKSVSCEPSNFRILSWDSRNLWVDESVSCLLLPTYYCQHVFSYMLLPTYFCAHIVAHILLPTCCFLHVIAHILLPTYFCPHIVAHIFLPTYCHPNMVAHILWPTYCCPHIVSSSQMRQCKGIYVNIQLREKKWGEFANF